MDGGPREGAGEREEGMIYGGRFRGPTLASARAFQQISIPEPRPLSASSGARGQRRRVRSR